MRPHQGIFWINGRDGLPEQGMTGLLAVAFLDLGKHGLQHDEEAQPNAADVSGAVTTELRDEAAFTILEGDASLTLRYTPSEGTASIWNGRDTALVLKAAAITPMANKWAYHHQ